MEKLFREDDRLGIAIPQLDKEWEHYTYEEQERILAYWERERAKIPDRIKEIEKLVIGKTKELLLENDEQKMVEKNNEVIYYASIINDLNIWFRMEPTLSYNKGIVAT